MTIKNKQKGFALVLSLVLLLAMSLMGGGLVVIASTDHQGNNSSDEYQQTFYVAETALMQAEKSLIDKMMGPIGTGGDRDQSKREIPRNAEASDPGPTQTPCFKSFKNLSRDANFRIVEQVQDQSFFDLIEPIFDISDFKNYAIIDTDDAVEKEKDRLKKFKYEFFSVNSGTSMYKGSGVSLKKTSGTTQRQGTAYRIYGCGMLGNVNKPQILIPLETLVVLSH